MGVCFTVWGPVAAWAAPVKWTSEIKKDYADQAAWVELLTQMRENHFHYGTVVGAERLLQYFSDIKTKEFAYQTLVESGDAGFPFSLSPDFIAGDIELSATDNFAQTYNLYKATTNAQKNMNKWADNYFNKIDKANFGKYLLYKALESARNKKYDEATLALDQLLAKAKGPENATLAKRAARTLARMLYEQTLYQQSFDIYQNYLLRLNPVDDLDWIEAAWALYRLGRDEEALGYLFNIDAGHPGYIYLEQYIIRSLIYREKCDQKATASLGESFDKAFGTTLEGIKTGKSLKQFPLLKKIYLGNNDYYKIDRLAMELNLEKKRLSELPRKLRDRADFLYTTELTNLERQRDSAEEEALDGAGRSLLILAESLRFLKFDVAREKYNPDKVFAPDPPPLDKVITENSPTNFDIHWIQWGDLWRDERLLMRALIKNRCE
jgi:hypothetical protein